MSSSVLSIPCAAALNAADTAALLAANSGASAPNQAAIDPTITALAPGLASSAFGIRDTRGIEPLSLPPEGEWETLEALIDAAQAYAKLAGYAVVEGGGGERRFEKGGRWTKYLVCRHSRKHIDSRGLDNTTKQRPNRQTKKTCCPMKMKIQERPSGNWTLAKINSNRGTNWSTHNHPPFDTKAYHQHRQFSETQLRIIQAQRDAGVPANRIKATLKAADPTIEIKIRDIYNKTAKLVRDTRAGLLPNEAFIKKLAELKASGKIFFEYTLSEEGRIEKVFIADTRYVRSIDI